MSWWCISEPPLFSSRCTFCRSQVISFGKEIFVIGCKKDLQRLKTWRRSRVRFLINDATDILVSNYNWLFGISIYSHPSWPPAVTHGLVKNLGFRRILAPIKILDVRITGIINKLSVNFCLAMRLCLINLAFSFYLLFLLDLDKSILNPATPLFKNSD